MGPLQQANGESPVAIHPGPDRHRASWVVKTLPALPVEGIRIGFVPVAGEASGNTICGDAQATTAAGQHMINRFGWFAAINATFSGVSVERLTPSSDT